MNYQKKFKDNIIYNFIKRIKSLGLYLTKHVQNLDSENHKTTKSLKQIKEDLNKWKDLSK